MKRQVIDREKVLVKHIPAKGLVPKTYKKKKKILNFSARKPLLLWEMGRRITLPNRVVGVSVFNV